jgi:plastocyanin
MKKSVLGIIIAIIALGGITALVIANSDNVATSTNQNQTSTDSTESHDTNNDSSHNKTTDDTEQNTPVADSDIAISNFAFNPANITVKKGATLTWKNNDSTQHDITPDNPTSEFQRSELLSKGGTYSVTFNTVGSFTYFCSPHPYMKGSVTVTD